MLLLMTLFACDEHPKSYFYDISSTVFVTDENGMQVDVEDIEICQIFRSEDYDTRTGWEVQAEQCDSVDIEKGIAMLPNWEGEYFGPDVSIFIEMRKGEDVFFTELLDNDSDVWCDNQVANDFDEHGNAISYLELCAENFERYLVWSLVVPLDTF